MILSPAEAKESYVCEHPECGASLVRTPKAPSTQTIETLDNGIMTKRVEQLKDIEQLMEERSHYNPREKP